MDSHLLEPPAHTPKGPSGDWPPLAGDTKPCFQEGDVLDELGFNARLLDFQDDGFPVAKPRGVDLADRSNPIIKLAKVYEMNQPFVIGTIIVGSIMGTFACFITTGCERIVGILHTCYRCFRPASPIVHIEV